MAPFSYSSFYSWISKKAFCDFSASSFERDNYLVQLFPFFSSAPTWTVYLSSSTGSFRPLKLKDMLFYRKVKPLLWDSLWPFFKLKKKKRSSYVKCVFTETIKPLMMFSSSQKREFYLHSWKCWKELSSLHTSLCSMLNICFLFVVLVVIVHIQCITKE